MSLMKCRVCEATYEDVLPDGKRYFHTCPEERVIDLVRPLDAKSEQLIETITAEGQPSGRRMRLLSPRNENVRKGADGKRAGAIAAGPGAARV